MKSDLNHGSCAVDLVLSCEKTLATSLITALSAVYKLPIATKEFLFSNHPGGRPVLQLSHNNCCKRTGVVAIHILTYGIA